MNEIIKDGTLLLIDNAFAESVELANEDGIISDREFEDWCLSAYYDMWLPRTIKFEERRFDRKSIFLTWAFTSVDIAHVRHFNLTIFKKLGYKIVEPTQCELELVDCSDDLLTEAEIVHKYMLNKYSKQSMPWVNSVMKSIFEVMDDTGMIFYKP